MKLYRLLADPKALTRCHMRAPIDASGSELDARLFTQGQEVAARLPLSLSLGCAGDAVDFNFGDFDMIVTPAALNDELESLVGSAVQRIPVGLESDSRQLEILNVVDKVSCVDENSSTFTKWTAADGRPEKVGEYRMFTRLRLNSRAAAGNHLFRVSEWPIALIASEEVKSLFESRGTTGLAYELVG